MRVSFYVLERTNVFAKSASKTEWALNIHIEDYRGTGTWTITTWDKKPKDKEVELAKKITLRSFQIYHDQIHIPNYEVEVVNE